MRQYDLSPKAQADVLDLFDYARDYSEAYETRVADALVTCFERLADFPHSGRPREDLAEGLRSVPVRELKVHAFYYPLSDGRDRVRIVRVLRQERDLESEDFS